MKKKRPPKVGDIVHITFYDHAENASDALLFEVVGRICDITRRAYRVRSWGYVNDIDRVADSNAENEHHFVIVKRAIESIKVL